MGTVLPCNRLADTFDVDMPSRITCSSCGNELSKMLSTTIECEVGLANLEAEVCKPTLLEEITTHVYVYDTGYHVNRAGL